jgi:two-component system phosphate regulon sensor histidine kinase PhoR
VIKGNLKLVVILLSVALVSIITIQVYWINLAIETRTTQFNQGAYLALQKAAYKIETAEAITLVNKQVKSKKRRGLSIKNPINYYDTVIVNESGEYKSYITYTKTEVNQKGKLSKQEEEQNIKKQWVDKIYDELVFMNLKNVKDQFNKFELDSIVKAELNQVGINTTVLINVYNPNNSEFEFPTKFAETLHQSTHRVNLFPGKRMTQPEVLMVSFPYRNAYIFQQMWIMLGGSIIFSILIITIFYYIIKTLINQKKLAEVKNDFVNNMTHELKTPISTIQLACEALSDPVIAQIPNITNNYISVIQKENARLGALVESVLRTASMEKGELRIKPERLNTHEIISQIIENFDIQSEKKKVKIYQFLNAEDAIIQADKIHFTNIINNLVDNAIKYSLPNTQVEISTSNIDGKLQIEVNDQGIGIGKEHLSKIFDKFYRVPTGNLHNVKGFGLGLSYVKEVCDLHRAALKVQSELNKGTRFTLTFNKQL